jgi:hypothetical protein
MDNPLAFVGAVLMGLGALQLVVGPLIVRLARLPPEATRVFIVGGAVSFPLGVAMFIIAVR